MLPECPRSEQEGKPDESGEDDFTPGAREGEVGPAEQPAGCNPKRRGLEHDHNKHRQEQGSIHEKAADARGVEMFGFVGPIFRGFAGVSQAIPGVEDGEEESVEGKPFFPE